MSDQGLIDLDYEDAETVDLDIGAIVRRGTRLRRRHLAIKIAAAVVVFGLVPGAVTMDVSHQGLPGMLGTQRAAVHRHASDGHKSVATAGPEYGPDEAGPEISFKVTLPAAYGPVRDLTGEQSGAGAWFWASASHVITLFYLTPQGKLSSWPLRQPVVGRYFMNDAGPLVNGAGPVQEATDAAGDLWLARGRTVELVRS